MQKIFLAIFVLAYFTVHSQTCVGIFTFTVVDEKSRKPVSGKLEKNILYAYTTPENEFYNNVEEVHPLDTILKKKEKYKVHENKQGYKFLENKENPAALMFPTICGLYLVQTELIQKKDTMRMAFYNIPAHLSFQIDSVFFKKGDYYIDLKATELFGEFDWNERGFYSIPNTFIIPFAKKEDE